MLARQKGEAVGQKQPIDRRRFVATTGAAMCTPLLTGFMPEPIQRQLTTSTRSLAANPWRELGMIAADAQRLGLSAPLMSAATVGGSSFDDVMPSVVELLSTLEQSAREQGIVSAEAETLIQRTADLLQQITSAERSPRQDREPGTGLAAVTARPKLDDIRGDYVKLFTTCKINDSSRSLVSWYTNQLKNESNRQRYAEVANAVCAPWYFIAIIHAMEASFNFRAHLHNGDPLSRKTVQVPANRPPVWNPPSDWASSAVDAIKYDGFADQSDWSLAATLYRWEGYNGWRSRTMYKINTPYLWSFSNHYTKGKFVADNVWDPSAVSKQCGAAVMLKVLLDEGLVPVAS